MAVYYNEFDPKACAWLRELISAGLLPEGEVDERSILDVAPEDLTGFTQCHFFAGIGGWPYALRLALIPETLSVWTGSPPCQPFSVAGKRKGQDDDRHLAPAFLGLVAACRPALVFGEQVASAAVLGPAGGGARGAAAGSAGWAWFDALAAEMETASYAVAAADLPASCIGAPHIRQRLFFGAVDLRSAAGGLALADTRERSGRTDPAEGHNRHRPDAGRSEGDGGAAGGGAACGLGDALGAGSQGRDRMPGGAGQRAAGPTGLAGGLADAESGGWRQERAERRRRGPGDSAQGRAAGPARRRVARGLADGDGRIAGDGSVQRGGQHRCEPPDRGAGEGYAPAGTRPVDGCWSDPDWLLCRDGRWRPVESGSFPLADGVSGRMGLLRGYGNAIVPPLAAEFVSAFMESLPEIPR